MENGALNLVALANELETFIQNTIPESKIISKYGGSLFTFKPEEKEGQFCGLFIYKRHVQISFSKGAELKDPKRLLGGSGKLRRHVNFTSISEVNFKQLERFLVQSSRL